MPLLIWLLQTYNPGNLKTELARHANSNPMLGIVGRILANPPIFGAYTELYSGLSTDLNMKDHQGGWVVPWSRTDRAMRPDMLAEAQKEKGTAFQLYEWCEKITEEFQ